MAGAPHRRPPSVRLLSLTEGPVHAVRVGYDELLEWYVIWGWVDDAAFSPVHVPQYALCSNTIGAHSIIQGRQLPDVSNDSGRDQ